ncbi:MAG: MFS transporter [Caulobacteraceae bacterium]|nr:MFS transporter [Caulobacteraceae bacterium]
MESSAGWRDLLARDLAPRFALLCLGVWLNAADTLVTATIMPSVARDVGGYAYFGWATAAYLLGSIVAGASAGRLSMSLGLRRASMLAGLVYAAGCGLSALGPDFATFVAGRLIQGLGAGAIVALCYVAIAVLFPERLWPRVFAAISGVWGAATLLGPLVGGLFAEAGFWRGAFWMFAAQALVFVAAAPALLKAVPSEPGSGRIPVPQLAVLTGAVALIAAAGLVREPWLAAGLALLGGGGFLALLRVNARASVRLLPRQANDLGSAPGAGYFIIFALEAAGIGLSVYGPAFIQAVHGASPLVAGYMISAIAAGWTITALLVAGAKPKWHGPNIRLGASVVVAGLALSAWAIPRGGEVAIVGGLLLMGAGFGLAWAFVAKRVIEALPPNERAMGSSAVPTAQMIGGAAGSAAASALAHGLGFAQGVDPALAAARGPWLFAALIPLALLGWAAAWRLGGRAYAKPD